LSSGDNKKMWSGRFRKPLDGEFEQWQRSLPFDRRLLAEELEASSAYASALASAGVLSTEELTAVYSGLQQVAEAAARDPHFLDDEQAEDIHDFVERRLVERAGDVGYKLHSGRSRNEQIATDLRLYVRKQCDVLADLILEVCSAFAEQAGDAHVAAGASPAVMPAYTHLQPAEPVLVAHWLLAYAQMLLRDRDRLADCRKRANLCPLGSSAIAGTPLPLDREKLAEKLGFDGPTPNSIDATSDRDFALEFVQALALLFVHLSRWAEEFILFATAAYGFVRLPEEFSTGSSAMPQKQNPDALELIRAKAARVIGNATALLANMKGLPLAYNKDLQETQQPLFDSVDQAKLALCTAAGFMRAVDFNFAKMRAAAGGDGMNALAAAMYLVDKGVPFRKAHEHVGQMVRACLDKSCRLEDLSAADLKEFGPEFGSDFADKLKVEAVIALHDVIGGTHPARVAAQLAALKQTIAEARKEAYAHA
jgi:argininosuccinate lyase